VLNPYDTNVIADYGARLIAAGELDRGIAMLDDAAAYSQVGTTLFQFYRFLGAYLKGDQAIASRHASLIISNASPYGLMARALIAGSASDRDSAKSAIDGLIALSPAWRSEPRRQLARFFSSAGNPGPPPARSHGRRTRRDRLSAGQPWAPYWDRGRPEAWRGGVLAAHFPRGRRQAAR
jgi:hypothetical protein